MLNNHTVLLLAGNQTSLPNMTMTFETSVPPLRSLLRGAGRVGRETAKTLHEMKVPYRVIETDQKKAIW